MKELEIKIKLIEFLLASSFSESFLAAEVRFSFGARRADIVAINDEVATVFEIKSANDSVDRLHYQVESYKDYFDYCYIVCVKENISSVRSKISKNIGIVIVDDNGVTIKRKAGRSARLNKIALASTLPVSELKRMTLEKNKTSKYDLCVILSQAKSLAEIKKLSRNYLLTTIKKNFSIFNSEVGEKISPDDILTITRMPPGVISRLPK